MVIDCSQMASHNHTVVGELASAFFPPFMNMLRTFEGLYTHTECTRMCSLNELPATGAIKAHIDRSFAHMPPPAQCSDPLPSKHPVPMSTCSGPSASVVQVAPQSTPNFPIENMDDHTEIPPGKSHLFRATLICNKVPIVKVRSLTLGQLPFTPVHTTPSVSVAMHPEGGTCWLTVHCNTIVRSP